MRRFAHLLPPSTRTEPTAAAKRTRRVRLEVEPLEDRTVPAAFEVWVLDQSNTFDDDGGGLEAGGAVDSGGTLYIYQGDDLSGASAARAVPEVIDLGGAARTLSLDLTGTSPKRPHYISFNQAHTHALISFVTSGHVLFVEAATRRLVDVIDVGAQAHAAVSAPDDSFVLVANQNGKLLQRIDTDADGDGVPYEDAADIELDAAATLNLAVGLTPNGNPLETPGVPIRPNNTPVFTVFDASGRLAFVTLGGGGMFVVNPTTTPISIVAEYDRTVIEPAGLLGVETQGKVYVNSGVGAFVAGGVPTRDPQSGVDLYSFSVADFDPDTPNPPNTPRPNVVLDLDGRGDAHGLVLTRHDRYLWMADRQNNQMYVIDTGTDQVVNVFDLAGRASDDPAPDIAGISPSGNRVFVSLRGPNPLTGNIPSENNAAGSTPGVGIIRVEANGKRGVLQAVAPISHIINGVERADPHGLAVREIGRSLVAEAVGAGAEGISAEQAAQFLEVATARLQSPAAAGDAPVEVRIADLPGAQLGVALGGAIWLDRDAAGHGWFLDPTPWDDAEFWLDGDQGEQGRIDLLTVLAHELGHVYGLGHEAEGVMAESLGTGVRGLAPAGEPAPGDSAFADAGSPFDEFYPDDLIGLMLAPEENDVLRKRKRG